MSILYSGVCKNEYILTHTTQFQGRDLYTFAKMCIPKIQKENRGVFVKSDDEHVYFAFLNRNDISYICICESEYSQFNATEYLEDVAIKFNKLISPSEIEAHMHLDSESIEFSLDEKFGKVFAEVEDRYNKAGAEEIRCSDPLKTLKNEVINTKDLLLQADEELMKRHENLENLQDKAQGLVDSSNTYAKKAKVARRSMCTKKLTMIIIISVTAVLFLTYVGVAVYCQGALFQRCINKD
ncbi:MAG: hypothetical protein MJ252_21890 [archaeon]|nr:hypothetical protein [archaeon]